MEAASAAAVQVDSSLIPKYEQLNFDRKLLILLRRHREENTEVWQKIERRAQEIREQEQKDATK